MAFHSKSPEIQLFSCCMTQVSLCFWKKITNSKLWNKMNLQHTKSNAKIPTNKLRLSPAGQYFACRILFLPLLQYNRYRWAVLSSSVQPVISPCSRAHSTCHHTCLTSIPSEHIWPNAVYFGNIRPEQKLINSLSWAAFWKKRSSIQTMSYQGISVAAPSSFWTWNRTRA